jgi:hypothetical protein
MGDSKDTINPSSVTGFEQFKLRCVMSDQPSIDPTKTFPPPVPPADMEPGSTPSKVPPVAPEVGVLTYFGAKLPEIPHVHLRDVTGASTIIHQPGGQPEISPSEEAVGRYQITGEIARGGMGAILKGRDTDLGRDIALKVLLENHKDKPDYLQRFIEEAQIAGQLQHPGITPIYALGQFTDGRPYFTMKLVKGQTLAKLLSDRADPTQDRSRFLQVFAQICQTLAYAHARGVIHRDLKPANIMVGAFGEVQVMDWGLAKVLTERKKAAPEAPKPAATQTVSVIRTARSGDGSDKHGSGSSDTRAGSVLGTPAYMPPEQAMGEIDRLDERADVFGLGSVLCEILTGKPTYFDPDRDVVLRKAVRADLADALARLDASGADAELTALAKKCLGTEPEDRPRDAGVVAEAMSTYLAGVQDRLRQAEVERAATTARMIAQRKAHKVTVGLGAAILLLLVAGGMGWLSVMRDRDARKSEALRVARDQDGVVATQLERAVSLRERLAGAPPGERIMLEEEALSALDKAASSLRDGADENLRTQVHALRSELENGKRRRVVLDRLDKARLRKADLLRLGTVVEYLRTAEATEDAVNEVYGQAFSELKLDPQATDESGLVAEWLKPIHKELAAVLVDWAAAKSNPKA